MWGYAMGLASYLIIIGMTKDHDYAAFVGIMMALLIHTDEIKTEVRKRRNE